jgi:hypothetical protein
MTNSFILRQDRGDPRTLSSPRKEAAYGKSVCTPRDHTTDLTAVKNHRPEAFSFREVTDKIESAIGRPLTFRSISDEEARQRCSPMSGSEAETEDHVSLWRAIREGRLGAVTDTVERVLGRKPVSLDQWLVENAGALR